MKRAGFTILEIMVTIMVLGVLVALSLTGYQGYRNRTAMLVDETNQKVILAAAKLYAYDNRFLPGNLSQLKPEHWERAYALVTRGKRPYTLWAFLLEQVGLEKVAEAQTLLDHPRQYLGPNALKTLTCPSDPTPPPTGKSYELTQGVTGAAGQPLSWFLNVANASRPVIIECGDDGVTLDLRHQGRSVAIQAGGTVDRNYSGTTGNP